MSKQCHCMLRDRKDSIRSLGTYIEYCPMHKAAPEMYEALKALMVNAKWQGEALDNPNDNNEYLVQEKILKMAHDILTKIEGV